MATKLSIYNNALTSYLGERKLSSLTESRKPRRILDQIWDNDFIKGCLEDGYWNFATRTFSSEYNPSVDPDFGFQYAHDKPADWVRTSAISSDDYFGSPLTAYNDETAYWFTDCDVIYVKIISDDASFGGDLAAWPRSFTDYVEAKLAARASMGMHHSRVLKNEIEAEAMALLKIARSKDAMNDPSRRTPIGSWASAKKGRLGWKPPTNIRTQ